MNAAQLSERPRIVVDMTFADKSATGTRVYAEQLLAALARLVVCELVEVRGGGANGVPSGKGNLWTGARNVWWLEAGLARELRRRGADLFYSPAFLGPRRAPCPMVVNVPDTLYLAYPGDFDYKWRLYARWLIPPTIHGAAAIITGSQHSKSQILRYYNIPGERVQVIPPGTAAHFDQPPSPDECEAVRARYTLGSDYVLFVGALEPRKNVPAIIEAVARVRADERFRNLEAALVGPDGRASATIKAAIATAGLGHAVRRLGFVPVSDLRGLYAGARALIFPSLAEGFGFPLTEAMAMGTPVVAAPCPPTPEVVGDAAELAEDATGPALARALLRVLSDPQRASELRARGTVRAQLFSWDRTARATLQLYQQVLNQSARPK